MHTNSCCTNNDCSDGKFCDGTNGSCTCPTNTKTCNDRCISIDSCCNNSECASGLCTNNSCTPQIIINTPVINPPKPESPLTPNGINLRRKLFDIYTQTELPDVVVSTTSFLSQISSLRNKSIENLGLAFPNSEPTFEIRLEEDKGSNFGIKELEITDSTGKSFKQNLYSYLNINNLNNIFALTLKIPKDIANGEASVTITLENGEKYYGSIYIIDVLDITTKGKTKKERKDIPAPKITTHQVKRTNNRVKLTLFGEGFAGCWCCRGCYWYCSFVGCY